MSGKRKDPVLSPEDRRLWDHMAGQIKPLSGRDRLYSRAAELLHDPAAAQAGEPQAAPKKRRATGTAATHPVPAAPSPRPRPQPELTHGSRADIDRRKAERLSRGKLPIEATLDLHGLRQAEAHRRLEVFLADCQAAGKRCVLIVTGKGLHKEEGGVLRANVPRWLNETPNRARVLSFDYAQQKHGGTGALYVLLRRRR
ncbi:Smr/MutS family protein [Pelagibius marinus]|uniref:Smr/MutS family protein n=1 Tax=Pelagibius marinus TaxID=2762760 RepID=UPI001872DC58|nr:Smr/MutS family protein [Pelagibius marinus]